MNKNKNLIRIIIQTAALLLFLVALPIGSWYYLRTGLDYRIAAMEELQTLGSISDSRFLTPEGGVVDSSRFNGKIVVAAVLTAQNQALFGPVLTKLHDQFDERADVLFLLHAPSLSYNKENMNTYFSDYQLFDEEQCWLLSTPMEAETATVYAMPEASAYPYFALVDAKGMVRRHYDVRNEKDVKRLVEHIALLLPREKSRASSRRQQG
jgi:hypothetical protein